MATKIRVFHVEDYRIMRDGVRQLLNQDKDITVVGEAADAEELMGRMRSSRPDILLLDIYLDGMENLKQKDGFEICALVRDKFPATKIIAHSAYDDADRVARIIKAGAMGFVSKKSGFDELVKAIKVVHRGGTYVCSETSRRLKNLNKFLVGLESALRGKSEIFSARERQVLTLLAQGRSSHEIADKLFITERTVESHRKNMIAKGHVRNTVELVAYASSLGIIKK
jgi:DNA-binding NarL/FixJ family response regulator